ncbi:MAG: hypothetical protein WCP26_16970 [Actinomycetes bacterium]
MNSRARRRVIALTFVVATAASAGLAGCSSGGSSAGATSAVASDSATPVSPTQSDAPSASDSPTSEPPTPTPTPTATESPTTVSPTAVPSPTSTTSPTTVAPSPTSALLPIVLGVTSTVATPTQRIGVVTKTDKSLAGKQLAIIKTSNGKARVIAAGTAVGSDGAASSYVYLQQSGDLMVVVPEKPLVVGPYDPATPLIAASGSIAITISTTN